MNNQLSEVNMSVWITDRRPTEEDCVGIDRMPDSDHVWVMYEDKVVTCPFEDVVLGCPWQPIVVQAPEPYVKPKRFIVRKSSTGDYDVYVGNDMCYAIQLPTREAAEEIAAIYERIMP